MVAAQPLLQMVQAVQQCSAGLGNHTLSEHLPMPWDPLMLLTQGQHCSSYISVLPGNDTQAHQAVMLLQSCVPSQHSKSPGLLYLPNSRLVGACQHPSAGLATPPPPPPPGLPPASFSPSCSFLLGCWKAWTGQHPSTSVQACLISVLRLPECTTQCIAGPLKQPPWTSSESRARPAIRMALPSTASISKADVKHLAGGPDLPWSFLVVPKGMNKPW